MTETTKPAPISEARLNAIRKRAARPVELVDEFALRQAMDDRDTLLEAIDALRQENEWISVQASDAGVRFSCLRLLLRAGG